jgi:hypothetical protein
MQDYGTDLASAGFIGASRERLGEQLMAEADAQDRRAGIGESSELRLRASIQPARSATLADRRDHDRRGVSGQRLGARGVHSRPRRPTSPRLQCAPCRRSFAQLLCGRHGAAGDEMQTLAIGRVYHRFLSGARREKIAETDRNMAVVISPTGGFMESDQFG